METPGRSGPAAQGPRQRTGAEDRADFRGTQGPVEPRSGSPDERTRNAVSRKMGSKRRSIQFWASLDEIRIASPCLGVESAFHHFSIFFDEFCGPTSSSFGPSHGSIVGLFASEEAWGYRTTTGAAIPMLTAAYHAALHLRLSAPQCFTSCTTFLFAAAAGRRIARAGAPHCFAVLVCFHNFSGLLLETEGRLESAIIEPAIFPGSSYSSQ